MSILAKIRHAQAVTPNNTLDLSRPSQWLSIGGAGAIAVDMIGGEKNVVLTLPAGMFELGVTRVYSTSTTATGIAMYWSP